MAGMLKVEVVVETMTARVFYLWTFGWFLLGGVVGWTIG